MTTNRKRQWYKLLHDKAPHFQMQKATARVELDCACWPWTDLKTLVIGLDYTQHQHQWTARSQECEIILSYQFTIPKEDNLMF